jgi:hypothetical protein
MSLVMLVTMLPKVSFAEEPPVQQNEECAVGGVQDIFFQAVNFLKEKAPQALSLQRLAIWDHSSSMASFRANFFALHRRRIYSTIMAQILCLYFHYNGIYPVFLASDC